MKRALSQKRGRGQLWAVVVLVVLMAVVLAAMFSMPHAAPVLAQGDEPGVRVGVVVAGLGEQTRTFCVTLTKPNPTGLDALMATGLDVGAVSGGLGTQICRIEGVGCTPPAESCFCQCEGGNSCAYWSYFHLAEQNTWQYSVVGAARRQVSNGDVEGWWWRVGNASPADFPPVPFETLCGVEPAFPRTVIDDLGRALTFATPPGRIASVTLGSDEILLDLVDTSRVLGVTYMATNPAISNIADRLDGIAHTDLAANAEYLISLDPDLVILASYNDPALIDQLLDASVPVFVLADFNTLDDVRANIRLLGRITGEDARAEELIETMDERLAAVRAAVEPFPRVRVLYYETGGITYGPGSTVDEIITLAGGINVIAEQQLGAYPLIDEELVLALDPDVVLVSAGFGSSGDAVAQFVANPAFGTLRAVQAGRVIAIPNAHMTNVSHYVVRGVEDVARALYPDAFKGENQ